jgi:hypothetical protein
VSEIESLSDSSNCGFDFIPQLSGICNAALMIVEFAIQQKPLNFLS